MKNYSTCATCHELLLVTEPGRTAHPNCATPARDQLQQDLNEALNRPVIDWQQVDTLGNALDRPRATSLPKSALLYATWGWAVFPCRPGTKTPLTRHGVKDATTNPDQISAWWTTTPKANIGLACGAMFDVIDIDTPKRDAAPNGYIALANLDEQGAIPTIHGTALTPTGGRHLYTLPAPGATNGAGVAPGIDYRATGGYVLTAPSIVNGNTYTWLHTPSPVIKNGGATSHKWISEAA